jgi:hypothetical protein
MALTDEQIAAFKEVKGRARGVMGAHNGAEAAAHCVEELLLLRAWHLC